MMKRIWKAITDSRFFPAIGWHLPMALACFGVLGGLHKIWIRQIPGLDYAVWTPATRRAEAIMLWVAEYPVSLVAFALVYEVLYLARFQIRVCG